MRFKGTKYKSTERGFMEDIALCGRCRKLTKITTKLFWPSGVPRIRCRKCHELEQPAKTGDVELEQINDIEEDDWDIEALPFTIELDWGEDGHD